MCSCLPVFLFLPLLLELPVPITCVYTTRITITASNWPCHVNTSSVIEVRSPPPPDSTECAYVSVQRVHHWVLCSSHWGRRSKRDMFVSLVLARKLGQLFVFSAILMMTTWSDPRYWDIDDCNRADQLLTPIPLMFATCFGEVFYLLFFAFGGNKNWRPVFRTAVFAKGGKGNYFMWSLWSSLTMTTMVIVSWLGRNFLELQP